jgi:fructokinase
MQGADVTSAASSVLVGGEALYDLVVVGDDESIRAHPGGGPFNTARTIGRLGQPVAFLGRLSSDRFGTTMRHMLEEDGVAPDAVVATDEPTTLALAEVDADGVARYRFYERGTSAPGLTPDAALAVLPPDVGILHVGTLGLTLEPMASALEAVVERLSGRALVVVDPNVRPWVIPDREAYLERLNRVLARTHVVKVSEEDLAWLEPDRPPPEAARALLDRGPTVALLTLGPDGALAVTAGDDHRVQAPSVQVVDTIGAGDAFGGGFVAWWRERGLGPDALHDDDLVAQATRRAVLVAALTCARPGASPPFASDVEAAER